MADPFKVGDKVQKSGIYSVLHDDKHAETPKESGGDG
jgi:hypothetical protein